MGKKRQYRHLIAAAVGAAALVVACGPSRSLGAGEHYLNHNRIVVTNDPDFPASSLTPYLRQTPKKVFPAMDTVVYDRILVAQSIEQMEKRLDYLGYFDSKIDTVVQYRKNKARVNYNVTLGERTRIDTIIYNIKGDSSFRADFFADSTDFILKQGNYLSIADADAEIDRIQTSLHHRGYFANPEISIVSDTLGHRLSDYLTYNVESARKCHFRNVEILYPADLKIRESALHGINLIRPGELYNDKTVSYTYSRFSSLQIFQGVNIDIEQVGADSLDCRVMLSKAKRQGFKTDFQLSTNSSGLMGISPQISYYNKNIFGGGEWLNVGFTGNFQFRLDDDTKATELGTSVRLSLPKFLGLSYDYFKGSSMPRTEIGISFAMQNRPEYTRNVFSASYGYSGIWKEKFYYQISPLQINHVRLFDLNESFANRLDRNPYMKYSYQDHSDIGVSASLFYTSTTDAIPKSDYYTVRFSTDLSGNIISLFQGMLPSGKDGEKLILGAPFSQYARVEAAFSQGWRFGDKDDKSVAVRIIGGIGKAYGNSTAMPYEKQFYCGGASSMRGWQSRALGPGFSPMDATFSIPSQTGDFKAEADVEYRFPLFWKIEAALFGEVGNVWDMNDGIDFRALAADWGTGLRLNLDIILIRVDLGVRLRDPALESPWISPIAALKNGACAIHFGVGYPF